MSSLVIASTLNKTTSTVSLHFWCSNVVVTAAAVVVVVVVTAVSVTVCSCCHTVVA